MNDHELITEFVIESQEHLCDVESQLLSLESQGTDVDFASIDNIFRAIHSIKGATGFLGLEVIQELAHLEEEVLNRLRASEMQPSPSVIDTLLAATDRLKDLLDEVETSNDQDVSEHLARLQAILDMETPTASAQACDENAKFDQRDEYSNTDQVQPSGLDSDSLRDYLVEAYDNVGEIERELLELEASESTELIHSLFRRFHTLKGSSGFLGFAQLERLSHVVENILGDIREGELSVLPELVGAFFQSLDKVREVLGNIESTGSEQGCDARALSDAIVKLHEIVKPSGKRSRPGKDSSVATCNERADQAPAKIVVSNDCHSVELNDGVETPPVSAESDTALKNQTAAVERPGKKLQQREGSISESSIRVDVALLDSLMTCVGELVLNRNQILQLTASQQESELYRASQRLNHIASELQEKVMRTRMQPIGNVWGKFPRLVRDLSATCKKRVRVEMEGKETELDKTIIEAIKDPLTHIIRNTVDHGIESPASREAAGKSAEGTLTLRAFHEGGQVNIEVIDDGGGINTQRVREKAIQRGLISGEQAGSLSDRDAANLIFLPGFSTAETVSSVSGRGVGMDVVRTNIEGIGGTVDLHTQFGIGTTIRIKIPLTLAIIPALIVECNDERYAIPQVNLVELVRLDKRRESNAIEWIQSTPVYRLRGKILPLLYLRDILEIDSRAEQARTNIVVLRAGHHEFGLVVDKVVDTEEIVVKPPCERLKTLSIYAGTTIMGDGQVALILDVMGLSHSSSIDSGNEVDPAATTDILQDTSTTNRESLLIIRSGVSNRYAVRLSEIQRIEKIHESKFESSRGAPVIQYRGEVVRVYWLSTLLGVEGREQSTKGRFTLLIYSIEGQDVGIVVDEVIDVVQHAVETAGGALEEASPLVVKNQVADLVDLRSLLEVAQGHSQRFAG